MKLDINLGVKDIDDAIKKLKTLQSTIKDMEKTLPEYLANETSEKMKMSYSTFGMEPGDDLVTFAVEKTDDGFAAVAKGESVAYQEFGTGDRGERHPHPNKSKYPLRDYNTGETIRDADEMSANYGITSGLYWTYGAGGETIYTQGVPAGMFVYNADMWLRDNYKELISKKVDDALRQH